MASSGGLISSGSRVSRSERGETFVHVRLVEFLKDRADRVEIDGLNQMVVETALFRLLEVALLPPSRERHQGRA